MALVKAPKGVTYEITPEEKQRVFLFIYRSMTKSLRSYNSYKTLVFQGKRYFYPNLRYYFLNLERNSFKS